jgi:hypothetical protein
MGIVGVGPRAGTLAGSTVAAEAMASVDRLLLLDDLWTSSLSELDPSAPASVQGMSDDFKDLVGAMDGSLWELGDRLPKFQDVLQSAEASEVDQALREILRPRPDAASAYEKMFEADITEVGVYGAGNLACQYIVRELDAERTTLAAKLVQIEKGEVPDPDLRPPFRCALFLAKLVAAGVVVIGSHGLALAAGIFDGVDRAVSEWNKSRCKDLWGAITGGRV